MNHIMNYIIAFQIDIVVIFNQIVIVILMILLSIFIEYKINKGTGEEQYE